VTSNDPRDRRSWSGTHFYIAQALQQHCGELIPIGPIKPKTLVFRKVLRKALKTLTGKNYLFTHTVSLSKQMAGMAEKVMASEDFDLIFAPASAGPIAYLRTGRPIVYLSDTTFAAIQNYYPEFSHISAAITREAHTLEQRAIDRASLLIFSSSWAAESARRDYHADPAKIHILPFGANIDDAPPAAAAQGRRDSGTCRLLFVGVDWFKKGGEIAFETLCELERLGCPAELTVVGCVPPKTFQHKNLKVISFLNKNIPEQRERLQRLYLDSDFFLLPTRADCSPIVLSEANAYGLPALATDVGGVPEIIRNGENGYVLPLQARGKEYATAIAAAFADRAKYLALRRSSRAAYDERLNWDAWGRAVATLIDSIM
jgi:glycosyltransferase involved in cell wall biosynthesis